MSKASQKGETATSPNLYLAETGKGTRSMVCQERYETYTNGCVFTTDGTGLGPVTLLKMCSWES
jgi:hypothetical protein